MSGSVWRGRVAAAWERPLWEGGMGVETLNNKKSYCSYNAEVSGMHTLGGPNSKCKGPVAETSLVVLGTVGRACMVGLYIGVSGGRKGQGEEAT